MGKGVRMTLAVNVDSRFKAAVANLQKDWNSVAVAYENFAEKKLKFAQKVNSIWLRAQELDGITEGSADGLNTIYFREQCQEMIQSTNKTILSKWITIGQNAETLLPFAKSLPSQRDSLYAISVEASRSNSKKSIEKWIKNGQLTIDSTVREVDSLRTTTKKRHSGTAAKFVKVTLSLDTNFHDSFLLLKDVILSDKVKLIQSDKALKSVALSSLDEKTFDQISKKFK
jgi:hypothetical protein